MIEHPRRKKTQTKFENEEEKGKLLLKNQSSSVLYSRRAC